MLTSYNIIHTALQRDTTPYTEQNLPSSKPHWDIQQNYSSLVPVILKSIGVIPYLDTQFLYTFSFFVDSIFTFLLLYLPNLISLIRHRPLAKQVIYFNNILINYIVWIYKYQYLRNINFLKVCQFYFNFSMI